MQANSTHGRDIKHGGEGVFLVQTEELLSGSIFQRKSIRTEYLHAGQNVEMKEGTQQRAENRTGGMCHWADPSAEIFVVQADTPKRKNGNRCAVGQLSWQK